jgi:hypothetical protein
MQSTLLVHITRQGFTEHGQVLRFFKDKGPERSSFTIRRDLKCGGKIGQSPKGRHCTEEIGRTPAFGKPERSIKKITE